MDLKTLRSRLPKVTTITLEDGSAWHIRKLSAAMGQSISNAFKAAGHIDPNGPEPSAGEMLDAYSLLLSKAVCDEAGTLLLDNDEGRAELKNLDMPTIQELAKHVQEWSLPSDAKKN